MRFIDNAPRFLFFTGKRFLVDALSTDEAQFRYLMDNAVASKDALQLSVGVALSSEQVAALTHDIVWMEEREVAGERVLVPVLYLAQANDRLAPSGALIQGRDVALISGSDLNNSGTLRASRNLDMTALGSINNSGLAQADARLSLLAGDSIRNTQGGILKGKDVSLVAVEGDVINERSITVHQSQSHNVERVQSFVGDASRIEAEGDLRISAGRDLLNTGGALTAAGNAGLQAGRDLIIASAEAEQRQDISWRKGHAKDQSITQYGSEVQIGGDLNASAGGDLAIVASTVRAGGDIGLYADGDITIASAANSTTSDYRHKGGDKKVERQESQVRQQSAVIEAGGNLEVLAGGDLTLMASKLSAGNEAYFYAAQNLSLLAAQNSDYYLYDMSKKGGWGSKETRRDEVTRIRNVGTTIATGGDLILESGGDQLYQRARLESGGDIVIDSDGRVVFEAVKDLDQESHEKSKDSWAWTSMEGEGWTDETVLQSQLIAKGELMIRAAEGLQIDLKEIDQHTVSQTIDAMVQADPDLAWIKEMDERGDIDWRLVKEVHDQWDYEHSGLGAGAALIIAIVVTVLTMGAGAGLVGAAAGTWQAAVANTVVSAMASNAAVSTINNRGNLSAVFADVTSSDALKGYAIGGITAGLTVGVVDKAWGIDTDAAKLSNKGFDLTSWSDVGKFAGYSATNATVNAGVTTAVRGGSFEDNLQSALIGEAQTVASAVAFNAVGDFSKSQQWGEGSPQKIALHAIVGGLISEAAGSDFATGAAAAGANEALLEHLVSFRSEQSTEFELMASQLIGIIAASLADGDAEMGGRIARDATAFNRQLHPDEIKFLQDRDRVKRFIEFAEANEGLYLSVDEAQAALNKFGAAMSDEKWAAIHGRSDLVESFISIEAQASGMTFVDSKGEKRLVFSLKDGEYQNEWINLRALMTDKSIETASFLDDNYQWVGPAESGARFRYGQAIGHEKASESYENPILGVMGDLADIAWSALTFNYAVYQSLSSDEVGPFDSRVMDESYQNLLKVQGRWEEAGFAYEYGYSIEQRQAILGLALAEGTGFAMASGLSRVSGRNHTGGLGVSDTVQPSWTVADGPNNGAPSGKYTLGEMNYNGHAAESTGGGSVGLKGIADAATTGGSKVVENKFDRPVVGTLIDDQVKLVETDNLKPHVIETFRNSQYVTVETTETVSLFRKFGGGPEQAKLHGSFASTIQNAGRQETAVYPAWSNSRFEAELAIPEGQKLNIGAVGQQPLNSSAPKYRGGADQVVLPRNWPADWVRSVRDGKTGIVYTFDEFKSAFPDQVTRGN